MAGFQIRVLFFSSAQPEQKQNSPQQVTGNIYFPIETVLRREHRGVADSRLRLKQSSNNCSVAVATAGQSEILLPFMKIGTLCPK